MIVLGLDTSTQATAVALRLADGRTLEARDDPPAGSHPGHATRLLALAQELLARAELAWSEIERIAVGVGPGSFTGLRVGVASARGLAQSLSVELVGVSSLRALAAVALEGETPPAGVLAVIDARRGEAFAAAYTSGQELGQPRELVGASALAPALLAGVITQAQTVPDVARTGLERWLAVGDGALRYQQQLHDDGVPVAPVSSALHHVSASAICALAASAPGETDGQVVPDYRRRPDAELALQRVDTNAGAVT